MGTDLRRDTIRFQWERQVYGLGLNASYLKGLGNSLSIRALVLWKSCIVHNFCFLRQSLLVQSILFGGGVLASMLQVLEAVFLITGPG